MLPNVRNYYRPRAIAEAVQLLAAADARNVVLGGGTSLALSAAPGIDGLVDLRDVGLNYQKIDKNLVVLGARSRPNDLVKFDGLQLVADGIVADAASNYLAEVQRNRASLGGILITASAWADLAATLLACGGEITVTGTGGDQIHTLDAFFKLGPAKVAHQSIIREIRLPAGGLGGYQRVAKTKTDASIVSIAARVDLEGGRIGSARVVAGGVAAVPVRLDAVEKALQGAALTPETAAAAAELTEVDAIEDFRSSAEYRAELARILTRRVLEGIAGREA